MTIYKPVLLGPLPVDAINATLGTELESGEVYLSGRARQHIAEDHPADYPLVMRHLAAVVGAPTFVGRAPRHSRDIELVGRVPTAGDRGYVLVAVGLELDERGRYESGAATDWRRPRSRTGGARDTSGS
jgi:hypothetical protein